MKLCNMCKQVKEISEFNKDSVQPDGFARRCRDCQKDMKLRHDYGITLNEYNEMFAKQNGCCAICGRHQAELPWSFVVDHDHETGEVRALLCNSCNRGIGYLQDNPEIVSNALAYLTSHS